MADAAVAAGAQFLVSPQFTPTLLQHVLGLGVPFLEHGVSELKFFAAGPAGA